MTDRRLVRPLYVQRPMGRPDETAVPNRLLGKLDEITSPITNARARARALEALGQVELEEVAARPQYLTFRNTTTGTMVNVYRDGEVWRVLSYAQGAPYFNA